MANLVLWSDLHMEFAPFDIPDRADFPARPDGVLLAGDTGTRHQHLDFARRVFEAYDCPVILVDGNHEPYGQSLEGFLRAEAEILAEMHRLGMPIEVLHGTATEVAGTRIVGATLWTDFALQPAFAALSMDRAGRFMNDYRAISLDGTRALKPCDTLARHLEEKAQLLHHLDAPYAGPTVVMTHHLPVREAIHARFADDPLNPAFASDLMDEILPRRFHSWVFGHSHQNNELDIETEDGLRRFRSNPRGYSHETTTFDPLRMIEA